MDVSCERIIPLNKYQSLLTQYHAEQLRSKFFREMRQLTPVDVREMDWVNGHSVNPMKSLFQSHQCSFHIQFLLSMESRTRMIELERP